MNQFQKTERVDRRGGASGEGEIGGRGGPYRGEGDRSRGDGDRERVGSVLLGEVRKILDGFFPVVFIKVWQAAKIGFLSELKIDARKNCTKDF